MGAVTCRSKWMRVCLVKMLYYVVCQIQETLSVTVSKCWRTYSVCYENWAARPKWLRRRTVSNGEYKQAPCFGINSLFDH
jgi:hypothetical protein